MKRMCVQIIFFRYERYDGHRQLKKQLLILQLAMKLCTTDPHWPEHFLETHLEIMSTIVLRNNDNERCRLRKIFAAALRINTCSKTANEKPLTRCPTERSGMADHEVIALSSIFRLIHGKFFCRLI